MVRVGVVIRHLPGSRPVASKVITKPKYEVDDWDHYFNSCLEEHKAQMVQELPELKNAEFYLDILYI